MGFGGGGSAPVVPAPLPVEREMAGLDEVKRNEAERIRRMRGRMSTFLTKGLITSEPAGSTQKLGT
jgi:hypothetical protein